MHSRRTTIGCFASGAAVIALSGALCAAAHAGDTPPAAADLQPSAVEEIYVLRSLRETRVTPTAFCDPVASPTSEDHYAFYAPAVRESDGRITNSKATPVGHIHGCFGKTADASVFAFWGAFEVNGLKGTARGDCRAGRPDFPEAGLKTFACYFVLADLAGSYSGGQLTTNSINSKALTGDASDPAGYTQVSIATIRLWKKR